jgi:hypothetical protein
MMHRSVGSFKCINPKQHPYIYGGAASSLIMMAGFLSPFKTPATLFTVSSINFMASVGLFS